MKVVTAVQDFIQNHNDFSQGEIIAYTSMLLASWGLSANVLVAPVPETPSYLKVATATTTQSGEVTSVKGTDGATKKKHQSGAGKQEPPASQEAGQEEKKDSPSPTVSISDQSKGQILRARAEEAINNIVKLMPTKAWAYTLKEQTNTLPKRVEKYQDALNQAVKKHRVNLKSIRAQPRDLGYTIKSYNSLAVVLVRTIAVLNGGKKDFPRNEVVTLLESLDSEGVRVLGQLVADGLSKKALEQLESNGLLADPNRQKSSNPSSEDVDVAPVAPLQESSN